MKVHPERPRLGSPEPGALPFLHSLLEPREGVPQPVEAQPPPKQIFAERPRTTEGKRPNAARADRLSFPFERFPEPKPPTGAAQQIRAIQEVLDHSLPLLLLAYRFLNR